MQVEKDIKKISRFLYIIEAALEYFVSLSVSSGYYRQIIQRIKELQPRAKIFLVTMPRENDSWDERRKRFRDILEDFTKEFNRTYLIDLFTYAPTYDEKFKEKFYMGHLTPTGYVLTARMIESYIDYMRVGLNVGFPTGDFQTKVFTLKKV